ncbi:hemin receptor [Denitrobaculum tricleocarpae]|uniref:Hemin receptor n=2 Tax=Denitrobaculum tricleocarpae TaxID=2591009 RepID=A0A545TYC0_9PROT|nr:hemin receptor [Denitrobaculum tricleocarpae]
MQSMHWEMQMALTNEEVELLRESFREIAIENEQANVRFYEILFEKDPDLQVMFTNDIGRQGAMLMSKLGVIVSEFHNMDLLAPMLGELAIRHVAYGVKEEHYPIVGEALIQLLLETLGDKFTLEAEVVWKKVYLDLSELMIEAAYPDRR